MTEITIVTKSVEMEEGRELVYVAPPHPITVYSRTKKQIIYFTDKRNTNERDYTIKQKMLRPIVS